MNKEKTYRVAVPSVAPGGLNAMRSGHFGRCDCFTLVEVCGKTIGDVSVIENPPHVDGGCLGPVNLLSRNGVNAIVVSGIGMRPLQGFRAANIEVFVGVGQDVRTAVEAFTAGHLEPISEDSVCGGH